MWRQYGDCVTPEVRAGHGYEMDGSGRKQLGELVTQHIVRVAAYVVELVHCH